MNYCVFRWRLESTNAPYLYICMLRLQNSCTGSWKEKFSWRLKFPPSCSLGGEGQQKGPLLQRNDWRGKNYDRCWKYQSFDYRGTVVDLSCALKEGGKKLRSSNEDYWFPIESGCLAMFWGLVVSNHELLLLLWKGASAAASVVCYLMICLQD